VLASTDLGDILTIAERLKPRLLVVDSVQTLTSDGLEGPAGSVGQVREAAARLGAWAHDRGTPVILVGHVTKDGSLAGPRTLEHLVDVVIQLEGDRYGPLRLLRSAKNRFGSTEEVGVLEMTGDGLREVADPARAFLGDARREAPGVAVAAVLEGTRPLLIEVQALVAPAGGIGVPRRTVSGLDTNRLGLLVAVLARRCGTNLAPSDLYASLTGGASVDEPAIDLPLALALVSSQRDRPVRPGLVACGEVSLLGELRPVRGLDRRLREAARLGFGEALVPAVDGLPARVDGLVVTGAATLRDALERALAWGPGTSGEG
jgi:DNA repair protein RadA/Sms